MTDTTTPYIPQHRLREYLDGRGIKIRWLAEQCGYTAAYVSRVLNGVNPLTSDFEKRCIDALGVNYDIFDR